MVKNIPIALNKNVGQIPMNEILTAHPNGHFYSPVVNPAEVSQYEDTLWKTKSLAGIEFDESLHLYVLEQLFPSHIPFYDYPEHAQEEQDGFFTQNSQFSWLDARTLFVLLKEWQPKKIVEVGSGYSSLLMGDVSTRFFESEAEIVCVEPFPRDFLTRPQSGIEEVIVQKVQEVPISVFEELEKGDVLFIDSSHVAKTGSDVNHIYFEILPKLASGVRVHVHDIFLPNEYPKAWVLEENRSWNEQYLLQALLMYSSRYRVFFSCNYAFLTYPEQTKRALNLADGHAFGGGSIWIDVI